MHFLKSLIDKGSMSSIRIQRTDVITNFLEFNPENSEVSKEVLDKVEAVFRAFKEEQKIFQQRLTFSLSPICLNRRNQEILSFMESRFTIPLTEEEILLIIKIAAFIKTQNVFTLEKINRYKIHKVCSISIHSNTTRPSLDDTIFIHLKKKEMLPFLGLGLKRRLLKLFSFLEVNFHG